MSLRHVLLLMILIAGCALERRSSYYETVAEARADGVFERGWMPDVLPDDAGPIREVHDLDTNARCAVVTVPLGTIAEVRAMLESVGFAATEDGAPAPTLKQCPFSWAEVRQHRTVVRKTSIGDVEAVVLDDRGRFYFWSASRLPK